MLQEDKLIDI